jgi:putative endonuclease
MRGGRRPGRTGRRAEDLAESFLVSRGFFPLARNHHTRDGEVDLVVGQQDLLVFAEVKLRRRNAMVDPITSVTLKKQRRVVLAALDYVQRHGYEDRAMRFDIIAITPAPRGRGEPPRIEHVEAAFDTSVAESSSDRF